MSSSFRGPRSPSIQAPPHKNTSSVPRARSSTLRWGSHRFLVCFVFYFPVSSSASRRLVGRLGVVRQEGEAVRLFTLRDTVPLFVVFNLFSGQCLYTPCKCCFSRTYIRYSHQRIHRSKKRKGHGYSYPAVQQYSSLDHSDVLMRPLLLVKVSARRPPIQE